MILLVLLALQGQAAPPTVGDTIWLTRSFVAPPGAEVRAANWEPGGAIGLLGPAVVRQEGDRTIVAYPAVAWTPGSHRVDVPGPIVIRRDGTTDSLPPESRTIEVASVLPQGQSPESLPVQPEAGLVRERITSPWPLVTGLAIAALLFAPLAWYWLRRGPPLPPFHPPADPARPPLADWGEAGESRAVAAAAARDLRGMVTAELRSVPQGLVTSRLIRVIAEQRPAWPVDELGTLLRALDAVQFAERPGREVAALARRVDAFRDRLAPRGGDGA